MTVRLRTATLLAAFVAAIAVLWGAGFAATAADASSRLALMSSDPAADSAMPHVPAEVVLTFNQPLVSGTVISVSAPDGETLASGPVAVHDDTARMAIASAAAAGVYTVAYTATDEDGRTTPGSFSFTVTTGTGPTTTGRPGKGHSASPSAPPPVVVSAQPVATASRSAGALAAANETPLTVSSTPAWWTLAGAALVVACVLVVFIGFRRRTPVHPQGSESSLTR